MEKRSGRMTYLLWHTCQFRTLEQEIKRIGVEDSYYHVHRPHQCEIWLLRYTEMIPNLFLLFLVRGSSLLLVRPSEFLTPILPLFPLLSRRFLNLGRNTNTNLSIMWLSVRTRP